MTIVPAAIVGLIAGRRLWGAVADGIGVRPGHIVPVAQLGFATLGFFIVAMVAALAPARSALLTDNGVLRVD